MQQFDSYIGTGGISRPIAMDYHKLLAEAESQELDTSNFPYRQMVGSLMYALIGTRPDLAVAVSVVSKYLDKPKPIHCELVRNIYRYIRANLNLTLFYQSESSIILKGYCDASYANDVNYKSRSGYGIMLGRCLIHWYSGVQPVTAQSSAESEYYGAVSCANEIIWGKLMLKELGFSQGCVEILEDNEACIALTKNPQDHKRTKHIQVKYHVIRDYVEKEEIIFKYCNTRAQYADMFTKALSGPSLRRNLKALGIIRQGEN